MEHSIRGEIVTWWVSMWIMNDGGLYFGARKMWKG
jgi:hypothetical protein